MEYDASKAVVTTFVGLVDAQAKGLDFPSTTVELDVSFVHEGLEVVRKRFAKTASGDIAAWEPYADGIVALRSELTESEVSLGVLSVVVYAYDGAGKLLGVCCMDGIAPAVGKDVAADFTLPSSPAFISIDSIAKNGELVLITDPVVGDDGVAVISEGGIVCVDAELRTAVSDMVSISLPIADDEYTLSAAVETSSVSIDNENKEVMGVSATEEPVEITAACEFEGENKTASFLVSVSGGEPVPPEVLTASVDAEDYTIGDTIALTVSCGNDNIAYGDYSVSLSDAALVSDNGDGTFTAAAAGTETFTVSYAEQTAEVKAVIAAAEEHELSVELLGDCCVYLYSDLTLPAGRPDNSVGVAVYYDGKELSDEDFELSVDNEDVAEYDGDGTLYLFKPGTAVLTATYDGCSVTHEITVSKEDLFLLPASVHPNECLYPQICFNGRVVDPSECVITSDAPGFSVDDQGFISFPATFSEVSELTVNCEYDGKTLSRKVSVVPFKLYLVKNDWYRDEDVVSYVGEAMDLFAVYGNGEEIPYGTYELDFDENFVRDNQDGTLSFIAAGQTTVTASYEGSSYSIDVDVKSLKAEISVLSSL